MNVLRCSYYLHRQMNALKVFTAFKEGKPPAIKVNIIMK